MDRTPRWTYWLTWVACIAVVVSPIVLFTAFVRGMQSAVNPATWVQDNLHWAGLIGITAFMAGGVLLSAAVFGLVKVVRTLRPKQTSGLTARLRGGAMAFAFLPLLSTPFIGVADKAEEFENGIPGVASCTNSSELAEAGLILQGLDQSEGDYDCDMDDLTDYCTGCGIGSISNFLNCLKCGREIMRCAGPPKCGLNAGGSISCTEPGYVGPGAP